MRIGIDVRYLSHGLVGGIHTYLMNLVPLLLERGDGNQFFLYADTKDKFDLDLASIGRLAQIRLLPYRNAVSSIQHDLFMQRAMTRDAIDVAHFPANYGFGPSSASTVVTLHDTLTLAPVTSIFGHKGSRRTLRNTLMTGYLHLTSKRAIQNADLILTVSEHAKQDIAAQTGISADRISVAPHAPGSDMMRVTDPSRLQDARSRLDLPKRFLLADALKNPAVLVRAWRRLSPELKHERQIVFFSRHANPLPVVFEAVEANDAKLLIRPSRCDLVTLYSLTDAFVFPSWFEGFGIPVIEAMACGAPVVASDRYSIPEVAGGAALIMDAEDDAALAHHLTEILTQPETAERLRTAGYRRAQTFSWDHTADLVLDAYARALALHRVSA